MVITLPQLEIFALVFARVLGVFIQAPVFNTRSFPIVGKTAIAIWIAAALWFTVPVRALPATPVLFISSLISEVAVGFLIGFICYVLFAAIQSAGEFIDLQMGLSVASAFDPSIGMVTSIVGRLCFYIGMIIFLLLNGHLMILSALHQSFRVLPVGSMIVVSEAMVTQLINLGSAMLLVSVQLAIPALILIFLSDFSFGIVSRVAPQVNVFMLGFQVKPTLGLLAVIFSLPLLINQIGVLTGTMTQELRNLFVLFAR